MDSLTFSAKDLLEIKQMNLRSNPMDTANASKRQIFGATAFLNDVCRSG